MGITKFSKLFQDSTFQLIIMSHLTKIETKLEVHFSRVYTALKFLKDFLYFLKNNFVVLHFSFSRIFKDSIHWYCVEVLKMVVYKRKAGAWKYDLQLNKKVSLKVLNILLTLAMFLRKAKSFPRCCNILTFKKNNTTEYLLKLKQL